MGVIYKLTQDVVDFIISQRQSNPLFSCRQLAESASQKFHLRLSKSSVHDVLKESGIITPRGRKPKDSFEIPQDKKKQIQANLSQVKLLPDPTISKAIPVYPDSLIVIPAKAGPHTGHSQELGIQGNGSPIKTFGDDKCCFGGDMGHTEVSPEYPEAGKIFLKAALWDLGIFSEDNIKESDWSYYLTYTKGIKVDLENNKSFFIDLPLPLERCIREVADGLINNIKPFIACKVSDEELFKACMEARTGFKIHSLSIVDSYDHILFKFDSIVEQNMFFTFENRLFVESNENNIEKRSRFIFFPQGINNNEVINSILNLKGFDTIDKDKKIVTLLINGSYENKDVLQKAVEKLNGMYLHDDQNRLVKVEIQETLSL